MRRNWILIILAFCFVQKISAQQDPMFTKYMFNTLVFNPAYAGSNDHLSLGILHRSQWVGIQGAPTTQTITAHTPLKNNKVGVGLSMMNDVIGPTNTIGGNLSYAYHIPIGKGKLSIGLQGGFTNWTYDPTKLLIQQGNDPAFSNGKETRWLPNFGAGLYYYSKYFYLGASMPRLLEHDLRNVGNGVQATPIYAKMYRHAFFTSGVAIPLNGDNLVLKPSVVVRNIGAFSSLYKDQSFQNIGAPTSFDVDLSLLFQNTLWVGGAFRSAVEAFDGTSSFDSVDAWVAFMLQSGLRIGAAYDYPLTKIKAATPGSFEIFLGYEFDYKTKKVVTPRYF